MTRPKSEHEYVLIRNDILAALQQVATEALAIGQEASFRLGDGERPMIDLSNLIWASDTLVECLSAEDSTEPVEHEPLEQEEPA